LLGLLTLEVFKGEPYQQALYGCNLLPTVAKLLFCYYSFVFASSFLNYKATRNPAHTHTRFHTYKYIWVFIALQPKKPKRRRKK